MGLREEYIQKVSEDWYYYTNPLTKEPHTIIRNTCIKNMNNETHTHTHTHTQSHIHCTHHSLYTCT